MIVRRNFPQVYELEHPKNGTYWLVSARSKRWGLNERKTFTTKTLADKHAKDIETRLTKFGGQPQVPKEKILLAERYEGLTVKLASFGQTPEDAVNYYVNHLGNEIIRQAKPFIRGLVDEWVEYKKADTTLSKRFSKEISAYARYIKRQWGDLKSDEIKKHDVDLTLKKISHISNNTRRKYLRYIRMFLSWVKDEGHIAKNPTDGIFYKPDDFNGDFFTPTVTSKLLRYVAEQHKDLIGYYALLTFVGLRASEGARVQWSDLNFKTNQLHVRKGKTNARYITLEPTAVAWMQFHRENSSSDAPFIKLKNLENREKAVRKAVLNGKWTQNGLRHGFATYYVHLINDVPAVAFYMGNSLDMVKRHYARTTPKDECEAFWKLTPANVARDSDANLGIKFASDPQIEFCPKQHQAVV